MGSSDERAYIICGESARLYARENPSLAESDGGSHVLLPLVGEFIRASRKVAGASFKPEFSACVSACVLVAKSESYKTSLYN